MRTIEKNMLNAIRERKNWRCNNTSVEVEKFGNLPACVVVRLHGNIIYIKNTETGEKRFTLAGWNSNTTRSRLRALGIDICQRNYNAIHKGKHINISEWYEI